MRSRLELFCDKLLEACWLAALILAPLFFNLYSNRIFEQDKASLIRSLALLMIGAWVVKQFEAGGPPLTSTLRQTIFQRLRRGFASNPLALPTLAVVIVYILATILSIAPSASLWGLYNRAQGLYTTFSYIVIFLMAVSSLRSRAQLERALDVAIFASLPVALYGMIQRFGLDPLPWGADVVMRTTGMMGNPIFLGAYLIMIVPLTLVRWLTGLEQATSGITARKRAAWITATSLTLIVLIVLAFWQFRAISALGIALIGLALLYPALTGKPARDFLPVAAYTIILAAQLATICFTESRGPWLGLMGGLFIFAVLWALVRGARRTALALNGFGLAAALLLFMAFLLTPSWLAEVLKYTPCIARFAEVPEVAQITPEEPLLSAREWIWKGALKLATPHEPIWSPTTGPDRLNALRPLIGYGPETVGLVFDQVKPPELGRYGHYTTWDRAHNETLDALAQTGLVGLGAYMFLFTSLFYYALKWLGLIRSPTERRVFLGLCLGGSLIVSVGLGVWQSWHLIGVALPAGMLAGFFIYLVTRAIQPQSVTNEQSSPSRALLLIGLIAAFVAHFIEIQFGIAIVATRTYFWFYAALLVAIGTRHLLEQKHSFTSTAATDEGSSRPAPYVLFWGAITTLILVTLSFEFIFIGKPPLDGIIRSLFYRGEEPSLTVFLLFAITWLVGGILGLRSYRDNFGLLYASISVTALIGYWGLHTWLLILHADLIRSFVTAFIVFYGVILLLVFAVAGTLSHGKPPQTLPLFRPANALVVPLVVVSLALAIAVTNVAIVGADIFYKHGERSYNAGNWDGGIQLIQRALLMRPRQDGYTAALGISYQKKAEQAADPAQRESLLRKSERLLLSAQRLNPLDVERTVSLGRLYRVWANLVSDEAQKASYRQKALQYFQMAVRLSPTNAPLHNEWAQVYYDLGDLDRVYEKLELSSRLDPTHAPTFLYLGNYHRVKGDMPQALENYLRAITLDPAVLSEPDGTPMKRPFEVLSRPEFVTRAIETYQGAITKEPTVLKAYYALAELYRRSGQGEQARDILTRAVGIAPQDFKVRLKLVNQHIENGAVDEAVKEMGRVLNLIPRTDAKELQRQRDFQERLLRLQRAIRAAQTSPNDVQAHRILATLWVTMGQPKFALSEYEAVLRLAIGDYDAQKNLALLHLQLGHPDAAEPLLARAMAAAPENQKAMHQALQKAIAYQKAGQLDKALQEAQTALDLAQGADEPMVRAYLSFLQQQMD